MYFAHYSLAFKAFKADVILEHSLTKICWDGVLYLPWIVACSNRGRAGVLAQKKSFITLQTGKGKSKLSKGPGLVNLPPSLHEVVPLPSYHAPPPSKCNKIISHGSLHRSLSSIKGILPRKVFFYQKLIMIVLKSIKSVF